ncbi:MAG: type II toxin-antitoxin system VapC family toxin [Bryobacteraceae bacterium]|nr:type II toxin-antitoxin system VapC family toxin [Bryobacteraceae bacterium]
MAIKWLLDASAVLAWLQQEQGSEVVDEVIDESAIASINATEVVHKLIHQGATPEQALEILERLAVPVVDFGPAHLRSAARLSQIKGLSLGDRACLAMADTMGIPAVTADRQWATAGPPVRLIRG